MHPAAPMAAVLPAVTTVLWFSRNYALGALTFLGMLPPIARILGVPFYLTSYAVLVSFMVIATTYSRLSELSWSIVRGSLVARVGDWRPLPNLQPSKSQEAPAWPNGVLRAQIEDAVQEAVAGIAG